MPIFNPKKVEKLPYKIYKAVSKHVSKKKRKHKVIEQLTVPIRSKTLRRFDKTYETYLRILVNNLTLTNSNGEDAAELNRETHYGMFINSPGIRKNKSILISECTGDSTQRAIVNLGPMPGRLKRARSCDTMLNDDHKSSYLMESSAKDMKDKLQEKRPKKYSKYIPVNENMGDIYSRSDIDSNAPLSWLDVQAWYSDYLDESDIHQLHPSKSESAIDDMATISTNKLNGFSKGKNVKQEEIESNIRFGDINMNYLSHASLNHLESVFTPIEVQIQLDRQLPFDLCRIKTDMISKCLYSFFHPFGENSVVWVNDVQFEVNRQMCSGQRDIFGRKVDVEKAKALICLEAEPAALLRHKDLCVLDTITVIMGIKVNELIIFQKLFN